MSSSFRAVLCAAAALASWAVGCGSVPPPEARADAGAGAARVVLGSGREAFERIEDGGSVVLIQGIQGAYHVWTSFLAYGFDGDVVRMELTTEAQGRGESRLQMPGNIAIRPTTDALGEAAMQSLGWPALVFEGPCSHGRPLEVKITISDMAGHVASDQHVWIVDVPEEIRPTDCAF